MNIAGFEKIAPQLADPLALVGFVLMLAYVIHWQLIKSGLLSKVNKQDTSLIIRLFLRYGFWLALAVMLAGFLLQFADIGLSAWNSYMDKEKVQIQAVDAGKVAEKLLAPLQGQLQAKDEQIKALTEAITALSKTGAPAASINDALQELKQGNTAKAQAIFAEVAATNQAAGQQHNQKAAEAYRHLGALAYMNNPKEALAAYQKAVQLDPDNADGWNRLGHLLCRTGELTQAEEAYRKVLVLGEAHQDKEEQAMALGNLGNVYQIRGELDKAEEMYRKSLEIDQALGRKGGMAVKYGNLGNVYQIRGELDKSEEMYKKALALYEELNKADAMLKFLGINEDLGSKDGMAIQYGNLGVVYNTRGELDKAEQMHRKALELDEALGNKESIAKDYGNLGSVHGTRGELDKAEEMYRKALALDEVLGHKEGLSRDYANLGLVYKKRGNLAQAKAAWQKSLSLFQEMGAMQHPDAKKVQRWLDELAK